MRPKGRGACAFALPFGLAALCVGPLERSTLALVVALSGLVTVVAALLAFPRGDLSPRLAMATGAWAIAAVVILAIALYRDAGSASFQARAFGVGVLLAIVPLARAFAWRRVGAPSG